MEVKKGANLIKISITQLDLSRRNKWQVNSFIITTGLIAPRRSTDIWHVPSRLLRLCICVCVNEHTEEEGLEGREFNDECAFTEP